MKVVLTGANGGVGRIVQQLAPEFIHAELVAYSRQELDVLDQEALMECFLMQEPQYVINAAAFTNVDLAQSESQAAYRLNADCLEGMVRACDRTGAVLIHLSTDYVFDGTKRTPYTEDDVPAPINTYGSSKRAGEIKVLDYSKGVVVRTSWVYSRHSRNFLATVPALMHSQSGPLYVDTFQINSPTYGPDLVRALFSLIKGHVESGLFHYTNSGGGCTRYEFACKVREMILHKKPSAVLAPILPMGTKIQGGALRPAYTVMSPEKMGRFTGIAIPHWQAGIENII